MSDTILATDFEYIANLVRVEAAISIDKGKEYLVQTRLEPLAKSLDLENISALVCKLKVGAIGDLKRKVVESLTTHETSFFRDIEPFEVMRKHILPDLIKAQQSQRQLSIWCGAASSGQEPYSLCMLLRENFPELAGWQLRFYATDISQPILERCRRGVYSQLEVNRGLPVRFLAKYFEKAGQDWQIKPEIRSMVEFSELNLLQPFNRFSGVDLVLLRNVLIYFDLETKRQILGRIRGVMKPTACLFLGTAETTMNVDEAFERVAYEKTSCYRRKLQ